MLTLVRLVLAGSACVSASTLTVRAMLDTAASSFISSSNSVGAALILNVDITAIDIITETPNAPILTSIFLFILFSPFFFDDTLFYHNITAIFNPQNIPLYP